MRGDVLVSSLGRIQRPNTVPYVPCCDCDGYRIIRIHRKRVGVAELVLEGFVGPRPSGLTADHINQQRSDNRLVNLRWATISVQNANQRQMVLTSHASNHTLMYRKLGSSEWISCASMMEATRKLRVDQSAVSRCVSGKLRQHHGYEFKREAVVTHEHEKWKVCNTTGAQISSLGRVRGKPPHHLPYYPKVTRGMRYALFSNRTFHVLVCTAFHGPRPTPRHTADHINRDTSDNRAVNLRWATRVQQRQNQTRSAIRKPSALQRKVRVRRRGDSSWICFPSVAAAARSTLLHYDTIQAICRGRRGKVYECEYA